MPFKTIEEIQKYGEYKLHVTQHLRSVSSAAVKFHYYPKFKFADKEAPLLLIGDVPPKLLDDVKKKGAPTPTKGRCSLKKDDTGQHMFFEKTGGPNIAFPPFKELLSKQYGWSKTVRLGTGADDGNKLVSKELGEKFKDEDKKVGWRTADPTKQEADTTTTKYDRTLEERARSMATVDKGKLVDSKGDEIHGKPGFVMDPQTGNVHTFRPELKDLGGGKKLATHHSTPLAGAPVAGAGHIETEYGKVKEIHDDSGHYKPSAEFTLQVVNQLKEMGAKLTSKGLVDEFGDRVSFELKTKYKEIQTRILAKLQLYENERKAYESAKKALEAAPDDKKAAELKAKQISLVQLRKEIEGYRVELSDLKAGPSNRPAKVQLQGKQGLSEEEFDGVRGDLAKINALIEKKTGVKNALPVTTDAAVLGNLEGVNLKLGEALKVRLTHEQFAQTGGNEAAIRAKAAAVGQINQRVQTPAHQPAGAAANKIEETLQAKIAREKAARPETLQEKVDKLGGDARILQMKFPAGDLEVLALQDRLDLLTGKITLEEAKAKVSF